MLPFIRGWSDVERTTRANVRLGALLAFVAGATNAGGFLAVGQYTSHMTGIVSSLADNLVLGRGTLVLAALASLGAFVAGAMTTAILVNWGLRRQLRGAYGSPCCWRPWPCSPSASRVARSRARRRSSCR